ERHDTTAGAQFPVFEGRYAVAGLVVVGHVINPKHVAPGVRRGGTVPLVQVQDGRGSVGIEPVVVRHDARTELRGAAAGRCLKRRSAQREAGATCGPDHTAAGPADHKCVRSNLDVGKTAQGARGDVVIALDV